MKIIEMEVSYNLRELGILPNIKGYFYLRDIIVNKIENYNNVDTLCKESYVDVAAKYNVTVFSVERCIRTAINKAYNNGKLRNYFNFEMDWKPSTSEFTNLMAEHYIFSQK